MTPPDQPLDLDRLLLHVEDDHEGDAARGVINACVFGLLFWTLVALLCWAVLA